MGAHVNYHWLIYQLVQLKNEFYRLRKEKYLELVSELEKCDVVPERDDDNLPDHKQLAKTLNYSVPRTCKLLKDLHADLVQSFSYRPLRVKHYRCEIHIHIPYDEEEELRARNKDHPHLKEYTWINIDLPFIPRIGESISLEFMKLSYFNRGYVHQVEHRIDSVSQVVYIEVHPYHHEFYRWKKLEEDYRWMTRLGSY